MFGQQLFGANQQVVEVERGLVLERALIAFEAAGRDMFPIGGGCVIRLIWLYPQIFPVTNDPQEVSRFQHVVVDPDFS